MADAAPRPPTSSAGLQVAVVTPEGAIAKGSADSVVVPGHDGEVAFLPGHAAYLGALGVGELRIARPGGARERFLLEGGVVQVLGGKVTVLAERVTPVEKVDASTAQKDIDAARALVPTTDEAVAARDRAMAVARARIRAARPGGGA